MQKLSKKVEYILDKYPETRNSDILLTILIWTIFHRSKLKIIENDLCVPVNALYDLPREDNVKRIRAKLQNEENKYLPTHPKVRKQRGIKEEQWRRYLGYNPEMRTPDPEKQQAQFNNLT